MAIDMEIKIEDAEGNKKAITLTKDQARELYEELKGVFGEVQVIYNTYPSYPYIRWGDPHYYDPGVVYCAGHTAGPELPESARPPIKPDYDINCGNCQSTANANPGGQNG